MKISTSLIKIRYAVGVMLALSAVFAVVIGTSTLQTRDATAQNTQSGPTLSISMASDQNTATANVDEGVTGAQFSYYLRVDGALTEASQVTVTASGDTSSLNISSQTVTIPQSGNAQSPSFTVSFDNTNAASGKRSVTLSLPEEHDDFTIATGSSAANSVTVTIHDDENSVATGNPVILKRQKAGTDDDANANVVKDDKNTQNPDDDTYSLGTSPAGSDVSVGDILVADLRGIADEDGLDTANGQNDVLGNVFGADRVSTTDAGVVLTGSAIDDVQVSYNWVRIRGVDDDDPNRPTGDLDDVNITQDAFHTVHADDIGYKIKVEVTIQDDAHVVVNKGSTVSDDDDPNNDPETFDSSSVGVPATLSISVNSENAHVIENEATFSFNVQSTGDVSPALSFKVKVSGASHLDLPASVDVNINAGTDRNTDVPTSVAFSNRSGTQGKQEVTLTLPTSVPGYKISSSNTAKVTIHDDENSKATGTPVILKRQAAGTSTDTNANVVCTDDKGTPDNADDTGCSLNTMAVSNGEVAVDDVLVVNLLSIADDDGLVFAKGWDSNTNPGDGMLGAVKSDGRVATNYAGVVSDTDDNDVTYTWTRIRGVDDDDPNRPTTGDLNDVTLVDDSATDESYTVVSEDVGYKIKVEVQIADDGDNDHASQGAPISNKADEMVTSSTVAVPATLSITAPTTEILEGGNIVFTVSSNANATADFDVEVSIDTSKAKGVGLNAKETVTIDVAENDPDSKETTIATSGTTAKEGKQTVVVSLPSSLAGFYISNTANSVTFTVHDTLNTAATGTPGIRVVQDAGTTADPNANVVTDDDTYSLSTYPVPTRGVSSGTILVADLNRLVDDADGIDKANGADDVLGAVFGSDKRVSTTDAGVVLTGTGLDDSQVSYQWKTVVGELDSAANGETDDANLPGNGAQGSAYTVQSADIGKTIYVVATFRDDADSAQNPSGPNTKTNPESVTSVGVSVMRTLTVTAAADVAESTGKFRVTVTSDAAVASDVTVSVSLDLEGTTKVMLPTSVDVKITTADPANTGFKDVSFNPVSGAQGKGIVTASLKTPVTGYILNPATAKTTIHDENSEIDGDDVWLVALEPASDAVQVEGQLTTGTTDDKWRRYGTVHHRGRVPAGTELAVNLTDVSDADGLVNAEGADKMLGIVEWDGRRDSVLTSATGAVLTPDSANENLTYQWKYVVGKLDGANNTETNDINLTTENGAQGPAYIVQSADRGRTIYAVVSIRDDAYAALSKTTPERIVVPAAGIKVRELVSFGQSRYYVQEGESVHVQVALSNVAGSAKSVKLKLASDNYSPSLVAGVPETVNFTGTDKNVTFSYTAPEDGPGTRGFRIQIATDEDGLPDGTGLTNYEIGDISETLILITDKENSPLQATSFVISDSTPDTPPTGGDTLTATLTEAYDRDGLNWDYSLVFEWIAGNSVLKTDYQDMARVVTSTYTVPASKDLVGQSIVVRVTGVDLIGRQSSLTSDGTAPVGTLVTAPPDGTAKISRIQSTARSVVVSAGDPVRLSVDVYGLQNVEDAKLGNDVTFDWSVAPSGGKLPAAAKGNSTVLYTAPSSPGTYTVTAKLNASDCYDSTAKAGEEVAGCSADIEVRVRRSAPPQEEPAAPVNPPGEIPSILADSEGEQYDVFTPVGGGMFDADAGYSITAAAGAVPNGEFIGVRMSDDGAASNMGMTHQRYTLGGNMYGVHVVNSAGESVNDYPLEEAAEVCVPLPDMFRARISDLALVTINSDSSLTILSANVRLGNGGDASVCGNLSGLPASVAVGSVGSPDAIPTATPVPTPVPPDTGGSAPSSNGMLWALLLGTAILLLGAIVVLTTRRGGTARKSSEEAVS